MTNTSGSRRAAEKVTLVGALLNVVLGLAKVIVGVFAHSYALVADGMHSFSDLATDAMVLVIARYAYEEPDEQHPYGHARFETLGTVVLGGLLIAVAAVLAYDAAFRLLESSALPVPQWPALAVAALSIAGKEWLFFYTRRIARRLSSDLLMANAWHSRTDSLSSVVVLVGVGGAMLGLPWLDSVAAIVVAVMVAKVGLDFAWHSVQELVDTALTPEQVQRMRECITAVDGVLGVHSLRSRRMGQRALLDVHIQVDPEISVSEGHHIGEWVARGLRERFTDVHDVTLHIDAEDDELEHDGAMDHVLAPLRADVTRILGECWHPVIQSEHIEHITLHYLDRRVRADVFFPTGAVSGPRSSAIKVQDRLRELSAHLPWLGEVTVWYGANACTGPGEPVHPPPATAQATAEKSR